MCFKVVKSSAPGEALLLDKVVSSGDKNSEAVPEISDKGNSDKVAALMGPGADLIKEGDLIKAGDLTKAGDSSKEDDSAQALVLVKVLSRELVMDVLANLETVVKVSANRDNVLVGKTMQLEVSDHWLDLITI